MVVQSNAVGRLEGTIESVQKSIDSLNSMLLNTGGLAERTTRMEETIKKLNETTTQNNEDIKKALAKIQDSISCFNKHIEDEKLHTPRMLLKRDVILIGVLVFIFLQSLIPPDINLWTLFSKTLGF